MISDDDLIIKYCETCKSVKLLEEFNIDRKNKDGKRNDCKYCTQAKDREYRKQYPEVGRAQKKRYRINLHGCAIKLVLQAKRRADKKNLEIDIDAEWVEEQYKNQNGCCLLTGIKFDMTDKSFEGRINKHAPRQFGMSIDRIDPYRGYTKDNCRLICMHMNSAMNAYGEEEIKKLAITYLEYQGYEITKKQKEQEIVSPAPIEDYVAAE